RRHTTFSRDWSSDVCSSALIDIIDDRGADAVPAIVDKLKKFGFKYATQSGTTWGIDEVVVPKEKAAIIEKARGSEREVFAHFDEIGRASCRERENISAGEDA